MPVAFLREEGKDRAIAIAREDSVKIAFIGFGEAARAFVTSLAANGIEFSAFDILTESGNDSGVRDAGEKLGVTVCRSPGEAVAGADWIISAVTAADSLDAGRSVARVIGPRQVFIDINSVSSGRKQETAALVGANGVACVDMAVMAPVHPRGHRTPVLIAGPACVMVSEKLDELGFDFTIVGDEIGAATSIKMIRSLFVKGLEAVTVQTLLAAQAAGRFDEVFASLSGSFPHFGWPKFPSYQFERVATHGVRRAAEMRESAVSMAELGFPAGRALADAIADVQQSVGELGPPPVASGDIVAIAASLARAILARNE
jgi:3-hydroxyisobutyrate dehydrogenase-like beta-hydroxyacid dehydrogenase